MTQSRAVVRRRGGRGLYKPTAPARQKTGTKSRELPEYMDQDLMNEFLRTVQHVPTRLSMMIQWRAGLRISEAANLAPAHVNLHEMELKVVQGKGSKDRIVPIHPELAGILSHAMYLDTGNEPFIGVARQTLDTWYKRAILHARNLGVLPIGKQIKTHTFRHSAARHWLANGVPINIVSAWLGHANLSTTMVYLQLIGDPGGFMPRVP